MNQIPVRCDLTSEDVLHVSAIEHAEHVDPWPREAFLHCFTPAFVSWGVKIDEVLVGYLIVDIRCSDWHILNLTIAHEHQHHGYARFLLSELFHFFIQQQADCIHLEVRASNERAVVLYESFGFVAVGRRKKYYPAMGLSPVEDAILYTYRS